MSEERKDAKAGQWNGTARRHAGVRELQMRWSRKDKQRGRQANKTSGKRVERRPGLRIAGEVGGVDSVNIKEKSENKEKLLDGTSVELQHDGRKKLAAAQIRPGSDRKAGCI